MTTSRTTVTAATADLDTLRAEARRRGVPLATLLAEAVTEKATTLRGGRRPHVGVARSRDGRSAADVSAQPIARPPR